MWLPGSQAYPAEIITAGWILAHHMIATTILLDGNIALGALLRVLGNPIRCLRVLKTFFHPLLERTAAGGFMPIFATSKAKLMPTFAKDCSWFSTNGLDGMAAIGGGAPSHQHVAFHKRVGDELLISLDNL